MKISATARYEQLNIDTGRIWIDITVDGNTYHQLHVSGPEYHVKDYFDGEISFYELKERLFRSRGRKAP